MIELYPEQLDVVNRLDSGKVLKGDTGSGKTLAALEFYRTKVGTDVPLYVITTARKRDEGDWIDELLLLDMDETAETAVIESWNNITKFMLVTDAFFIFDEQRAVGNGIWAKTMVRIAKSNFWIMCTATPGDTWLDYAALFTANGFYRSMNHYKNSHFIYSWRGSYPQLVKIWGTDILERHKASIIIEMESPPKKEVVFETLWCDYDEIESKRLWKERNNKENHLPYENVTAVVYAARRILNSIEGRKSHIISKIAQHKRVILFYNYDYELNELRMFLADIGVRWAEWNGHLHQPLLKDNGPWVYLVQYTAGCEAWNCIVTNCTVFYSLPYSYKQYIQSQGRINRRNSPYDLMYYSVLLTSNWVDAKIVASLNEKHNFQPVKLEFVQEIQLL